MHKRELLNIRRADIFRLAEKHGAVSVRVFGSVARREDSDESDIDLLVKMQEGRTLLDLVGLSQDLESLLHTRIDVLTDDGLSPYLAERIKAEAVPI